MLKPIYDENIIVAIKISEKFFWCVLEKEKCYMSLNQTIFNNDFERNLEKYKVNIDEIRLEFIKSIKNNEDIEDYIPVMYWDFNNKIFYSKYPEPDDFDEYLLENWTIDEYSNFIDLIDEKYKYWLYKNVNFFEI